jgi:hypothetical protein
MDEILKKYQDQLDQAIKFSEKINRQKSYLVDLLIKDKSPSSSVIIGKYLDWLEESEPIGNTEQLPVVCNKCNDTKWVCENHPDQEAHECKYCGGAGMRCECTKKASEK